MPLRGTSQSSHYVLYSGSNLTNTPLHYAGILEGIFSVGMLFLGWRTLSGPRKALQKAATSK